MRRILPKHLLDALFNVVGKKSDYYKINQSDKNSKREFINRVIIAFFDESRGNFPGSFTLRFFNRSFYSFSSLLNLIFDIFTP
jgi:hypothetical protein